MHLVPRKTHSKYNGKGVQLWMTPGLAWGVHLSSEQWFLFGRQVGMEGVIIWITWRVFSKHKYWIRISGGWIENEYGSPENSNVFRLLPILYAGARAVLFITFHYPRRRSCKRRRERKDSQGKSQIMSTRGESLYVFYIPNHQKVSFYTNIYARSSFLFLFFIFFGYNILDGLYLFTCLFFLLV